MEKDILYIYKTEVELIKSVIDLAASRRVPINSRGEYDEWLSFDSITEALDDICKQINVNRQVEQHCYQTLLRMSAESEKHLTWWEKIAMIHRYLPHHTHEKSSKHSPSNVAHHHQQASASHKSLPTPTPHLMRLVEPERATLTRPSNIPTTSPGTLLEINNLSMLLNDTYGFQTKHELQRNRSSVPDSGLYVRRNLSTQDIHTSRGNISFADTTTPVRAKDSMHNFNEQGWMSHIGPSSSARRIHFQEDPATPDYLQRHEQHSEGLGNKEYLLSSVMEKVSSIEKETQLTKDILSGMYRKGRGKSDATTTEQPSNNDTVNPAEQTPQQKELHKHDRGDWTLSPSVIHNNMSTIADTPMVPSAHHAKTKLPAAAAQPPAPAPVHNASHEMNQSNNTQASSDTTYHAARTKSRAFSDLLRHSSAMSKYMGLGNQQSSPRRAQSTSPSRQPVPPTPPARDDADLSRASAPRRSHLDTTPEVSQSSRKKVLFDSPSFSPPTHHRPSGTHSTMHVGSHSTSAEPITPRSSSFAARHPSTFTATPSRVVPLALQGKHGAGGLYTPEGHIDLNALDFDARVLQSHAAYANSMSGMDLSADLSHTMGSAEGLVDTITSTTRILIIFHRWLLRRSDHNNVHFDDDRNAALMLICHFEGMNNFVTSLFGLEQWLRDKMKLIVRTEAKAFVFRTWNLKYGVSAKSREFWRRRRLHFGFESFLEYGMKRRMHRKNALHALAARRRHANAAHMGPILRHKPARSSLNSSTSHIVSTAHFSDEENEEADFSYPDSSSVPQLSRLSDLDKLNKYSNLDMSMLDMEKRHRAKQAQYFTSLSIRDILNDTKSALLVYSRGGTSAYNLRTKTQEYLQAQDTVALLFAFRRFYHRAIYITRQRKLRLLRRNQRLCACLAIWKAMYAERAQTEQALQPHVEYALEEMKVARKRIALRKLKRFVLYSQRDTARKARFAARIRSKQIYLRAFHALRCLAFVKCFDVLKSNYIKNSPTVEEIRHSAFHHQYYAVQSAFKGWRKWLKACAATRLNGFQSQSSRQLLMNTLLQKSHIRHLVQDARHNNNNHHHHISSGSNGRNSTINMSPHTFFSLPAIRQLRLKPSMLKHTVHLTQLKRAMRRLRKIGRCTRIFFALTDLRAAQSMGRRNVASDRLKCAQHVTLNSCRILPSARDNYKNNTERDRDSGQVTHLKVARRAGAEKPFKLIGVNPLTFELFVRTLFHSTPPERHELDASFSGQANKGHRSGHRAQSLVLMDGTKLSAAPQLLRFTRKWRILCSERTQLRKICDKVRRARALAVLKAHYEEWQKAYKQERMCNQCNKRRVLRRFQAFRQRNRHAHKVHKKTRRDLVIRHWQRLAAAHLHHTELRRLQAGHFYNAVLDGSSRRVLDFVAKHDFVPFSVRHFLSHFPSYRFPIYRQYDEAYWDHARHTDAHQALVMISQHHEAYTHDRHVTHHLELFQHHHHANFQTASASRRNSDPTADTSTRAGQPHTYATPSHHSTFVQNSRLYQSPNRPLHLTPGAMLSHQAFSVSASIANSKYGRSGSVSPTSRGRGRSSSTSPTKGNNHAKLSLQTSFDTAQDQASASYRTPSGVHSSSYGQRARSLGEVPAASELASAAMFMSHWISECLQQYYTLRRALRKLRHFGRKAGHRTRKLYLVALSKQRVAVAALWQNRQDRKLTKQVRLARLRDASLKLRAVTVYLKARKRILRKIIEFMCQTHRHNLVVRTWQNRWNNVMRSAWDKLLEHTKLRNAQFAQIRNTQNRIRTVETVRIMCGVVTANSWRRRHAKVTGLRNFVQNYNRSVLAMDRDNTVRLAARIKQFGIFKENLLGKLKQRLSDVVGMNYRKKSALISGFMALYCAVQQPQRQIDEATLKERMYDSIDALREKHLAYVTHQLRPGSDPADLPLALHVREHRKMRHLETMAELRASTSPYVSAVLPLPSPLPPAHTISTTVRRASMLRESGRQRATIDTLSESNPQTNSNEGGGGGGLSVNTSMSGVWSPTRGTPRSGTAANILFGAADSNGRSPYPVSGSAWDDFSVLSGTNGPSTRPSSATLSAMAQRRRNAASSAANTPKSSAGADSRESAFASTYRTASGNNSPFSAGGRRSTDPSVAPSSYGSIGGFKNSVETSRFGYSLGSSANSVVSNVSNYTSHTRKSSLHDAHAAVINSPTSARPSPAGHINTDPLAMSLQVPSGRSGPASILITSPAYVGSRAASRADSRIFFATSPLASGPASVASARSGGRGSVSVQGQMASSSIASRRSSVPPLSISSSVGNREASLMPPFSPLTPQTYREDNFFDDASTDASTVFTTDTPRGGGSSMRVQRRRSSVHQQRSEESVEQMWQLERAQKLYIFRRWVNELRHKKALRQYCESYHLRQLVRIHFLRMRRQAQIDRYQRVQLARVAAHRALTQLSDMCARNTEHRQILEFSEKYYLVMALKLNLRKWRARVKRRTLNRYDAINAKTFNKRRAFMKFMINLRAICTQLPLPGEGRSHSHSQSVGRYDMSGSPGRARSNFSATEWKHHSPGVSRNSSSSHRTNRAMSSSNHHLQSSSAHRLRRHQSPLRSPYSSPHRSGSSYSSPHHSGYERTKGIPGHREHKQHQYHVHYADEEHVEAEEYENRLFRSAGALTKRSIASILNK